ncbi:MAG: recombinase family protein [Actinomycetota bacterium]|nr:recombinase family protein [Actinomycetota bacterium]
MLIRQVLGAISQYERGVIAARMMAGKIARARQGFFAGGKVPDGYKAVGDPARFVLDPERAPIIREAGERVIAGETVTAVAHDFVRRGIPGPAGNGWEPGYLARMLRNTTYAGEAKFRMREAVEPLTRRTSHHAARGTKSSQRARPEDEWITIECPAIFAAVEWQTLQAALARRGFQKNQSGTYLLSRRFRSRCGSTYVGNYNAGKIRYLCQRRTKRGITGEDDCGCPQIFAETVDEAVWRAVAGVLQDPGRLATIAREELRRRGIAQSESKLKKELETIDRKLTRARDALGRLVRHHAEKATLDDATFETAAAPMRDHVQALERDRENLLRALPGAGLQEDERAIQATADEVIHRLQTLSFAEKNRLLALLDVEVHVDEDGLVKASLRAPRPEPEDQRKVCFSTYSRSRPRTFR